ncbi:MAG: class I SAM-dependent methyltransferase [Candidatus Omnitrophota bacterium]
MSLPSWAMRLVGPFGFQTNSDSRVFEYPWCFFTAELIQGMKVLDFGSGGAGFQFALAASGADVTSVDPLVNIVPGSGWLSSENEIRRLIDVFGGKINFIREHIDRAGLPEAYFDRIFSVSSVEHIPYAQVAGVMKEICRLLKPGGIFVATVDLFLDCYPFSEKTSNVHGSNISIKKLIDDSGLCLRSGRTDQLYGFPDFYPEEIVGRLGDFLTVVCSGSTILTQCFVFGKSV